MPDYIEADHSKMRATFTRVPQLGDVPYPVQMEPNLVVDSTRGNQPGRAVSRGACPCGAPLLFWPGQFFWKRLTRTNWRLQSKAASAKALLAPVS